MKKGLYFILMTSVILGVYFYIQLLMTPTTETLRIWVDRNEYEVLQKLNDKFEKEHQVKIQMEIVSSEQVLSTLPLRIKGRNAPDIINVSHTLISDLVKIDAICPISEVFDELSILPSVKSGFKVKGDYYGVPYNAQTDILFYNKENYPYGIRSFNQLDAQVSLAVNFKDINHVNPFVTGLGGYIVGTDNFGDTNFYDIGLNQESSVAGLNVMFRLIDPSLLQATEYEMYQAFLNQEIDLLIAPASMIQSLNSMYPQLGYQAIPNFIEEVLPYTYMEIDTYQVTNSTLNYELAIEYLKFLLSSEVAKERYDSYQAIAPIDYEYVISQDEAYTVIKKQLHRSTPLPNQIEFSILYGPFKRAIESILYDIDGIEMAMEYAVSEINSSLESVLE